MRIAVSEDGITFNPPMVLPTPMDFDEGIARLRETAMILTNGNAIAAAAGGVPGPLDSTHETLAFVSNLPGWRNKPIREEIAEAVGAETYVENDSALAGLGEAIEGNAKGSSIAAFLSLGTGVGGVRLVHGAIAKSDFGFEPGHQIIVMDGDPCGCGGRGHLESYVSGEGIRKRTGKKPETIDDPALWEELARFLAAGIVNTIVHWSPNIVILGGSHIPEKIPLDSVRKHVAASLFVFSPPRIQLSKLKDRAVLTGALAYIRQKHG